MKKTRLFNYATTKTLFFEVIFLFIITVPAFLSLLNNQYFSMHDDQHIVRLYLLDKGISQGYFYPRWVDMLGFGYGYPLFNFYPPLTYYLAEFFHLIGFSFIWSIKSVFILGFLLSSISIYLFSKNYIGRSAALLSAVFYTFFSYHAVNIYVRGALAEFFSMSIVPFVFLTIDRLSKNISFTNSILFGLTLAVLILTHPLIALSSLIFIGFFAFFHFLNLKMKLHFTKLLILGVVFGLCLSYFFWFPSLVEKKFTMVNEILTRELANYKLHYIYPSQFLYSLWGYGGSIKGINDGMSFQLGKLYILFVLIAVILSLVLILKNRKFNFDIKYFHFFLFLLLLSLFMTTPYSFFIWDNFKYLWYLQFPWRFLTFGAFFISVVASYSIFLLSRLFEKYKWSNNISMLFIIFLSASIILVNQKYFKPQKFLNTNDRLLTSYDEIAWRISRSSFEFIPKGVQTTKSDINTTIPLIKKETLPQKTYEIVTGSGKIQISKNNFLEKTFYIDAFSNIKFRLNTYFFPGWKAYLDGKQVFIDDFNDLKLITVNISKGKHEIKFILGETNVRKIADVISFLSLTTILVLICRLFYNRFMTLRKL